MITAIDEIFFKPKGENETEIEYKADICLNGFYVLFTPLIRSGLNKVADDAREGMRRVLEKRFGRTY